MFFLIDGYNLFHKLFEEETPFSQKREEFIELIKALLQKHTNSAMMIFDGHYRKEDWQEHVYMHNLTIVYSAHAQSADEAIIERLQYHHFPIRPVVVSSDKKILQRAKELRFEVLSSQSFIHLCNKENSLPEEKVYEESLKEMERLQKIFENKLKE